MRETGIVRRIDELGRVVIPKEIRRTLRIKEGDPLEIYTEKDELVFKKYSPIASVEYIASGVCESISQITDRTCYVTDTDNVIYVSGGKKELLGKNVSGEIDRVMKDRKSVVKNRREGNILPLVKNDESEFENQIIVPIVANGDCYGSIIVTDKDKKDKFGENDVKIVQLGAMFLAKQFE